MEKQELADLANSVYEETFWANQYWAILKQYDAVWDAYSHELSYSPAFHSVTRLALYDALIMRIAKLYETGPKIAGIRYLLDCCLKNPSLFPEGAFTENCAIGGKTVSMNYPHKLNVAAEDAKYLPETALDTYLRCRAFLKRFSCSEADDAICIEVTTDDLFQFYQRKLSGIAALDNLRKQRNSYYAHLDKRWGLKQVEKENPILTRDIETMLSLSMELCRTVIELLTGTVRAIEPINIDDLENTLTMVRLGSDYQQNLPDEIYEKM